MADKGCKRPTPEIGGCKMEPLEVWNWMYHVRMDIEHGDGRYLFDFASCYSAEMEYSKA